ncbi:MAG: hypothetical protein Q4C34_03810 [Bacteroidales bacterium]|nr:hypothetical protein [Bacteroidales bacterium]
MAKETEKQIKHAQQTLPGAAADAHDEGKATPCEVRQDVKHLNNNPRSTDNEMP